MNDYSKLAGRTKAAWSDTHSIQVSFDHLDSASEEQEDGTLWETTTLQQEDPIWQHSH